MMMSLAYREEYIDYIFLCGFKKTKEFPQNTPLEVVQVVLYRAMTSTSDKSHPPWPVS